MFYLPTTKDGMNAAVGQFIWGRVSAQIDRDMAAFAASPAASDPNYNPYAPKKSQAPKSDAEALADFCAMVRARQAAKS